MRKDDKVLNLLTLGSSVDEVASKIAVGQDAEGRSVTELNVVHRTTDGLVMGMAMMELT